MEIGDFVNFVRGAAIGILLGFGMAVVGIVFRVIGALLR